jgi:O-antigen/teichoic acid export membrane protein
VNAQQSLKKTAFTGVMWLMLQSVGGRLASIAAQIVLAKILMPSEFGVISFVYTITGIAAALVNFGVDGVLVQRIRSVKLWLPAAFFTSLTLSLAGWAIVVVLAFVLAPAYHSPQLPLLSFILAASMPLGALSTIPAVRLRSEMNFRFPALYGTFENIAIQAATVLLACLGAGVFSFVLPLPVFALLKTIVYWYYKPSRLAVGFKRWQFLFLIKNGMSILFSRLAIEAISQGDYAVLGVMATHSQVGLYFFAFRLAVQPVGILAGNFMNVLLPALMHLKMDPNRQVDAALRAAKLLAYVAVPTCFLQAAIARDFLHLFFQHKWDGSILLMQLLSIGLSSDAVTWISGTLIGARREYRFGVILSLFRLPAFFGAVVIGAALGKEVGVAVAVMCYHLVHGPVVAAVTLGRYGASVGAVLELYWKPALLAGIPIASAYGISLIPAMTRHPILCIAETAIVSIGFYLALLIRFEPAIVAELGPRIGIRIPGRRLV